MHVYFSHSYRDVAVNSYFLSHFVRESLPLRADGKSDTWCVAKLERYLFEASGFISVIPRRATATDPVAYSAYIGQELNLARRARVPRLLFVDEQVLDAHELDFPQDAVPFVAAAPDSYGDRHAAAIREFRLSMPESPRNGREPRRIDQAAIVVDDAARVRAVAPDVSELLRRQDFTVEVLQPGARTRALDNVRLLETLFRSHLCVFLLGERLSEAHLTLAMAYAHCIPSIRLQYDRKATSCEPGLTGAVPWAESGAMLAEFKRQLVGFRRGFVEPVRMALDSTAEEAARKVGTTQWEPEEDDLWKLDDGPALARHVRPDNAWVQDEVNRALRQLQTTLVNKRSREGSLQVCRALYDGFRRHRFAYETEPQAALRAGMQKIRPPSLIEQSKAATCIDLACFFASLLEAGGQNPLIVVLRGPTFAHALAGYRSLDEPAFRRPRLGDLRRAVTNGDAVVFEATGAVEAEQAVGEERPEERQEKLLDFLDAQDAARRMILRDDVDLLHLVDVRASRG